MKNLLAICTVFLLALNPNMGVTGEGDEVQSLIDKLIDNPVENRSEEDFKRLYGLLKPRAESGDQEARYYLSIFYASGWGGVERDASRAFDILESLAREGHQKSQYALAHAYEHGSFYKADHEKALRWYEEAANSGYWLAINRMIKAYENGELGLEAQPDKAAYWKSKQKQ